MKFPGSKLLHRFDLLAQRSSLEDLLRSSRDSGFTGLVEVGHEGATGLIFYYLGAEVNAVYREGASSPQRAGRPRAHAQPLVGRRGHGLGVRAAPRHGPPHARASPTGRSWADPVRSRTDSSSSCIAWRRRSTREPSRYRRRGGGDGPDRARARLERVLGGHGRPDLREGEARNKLDEAVTFGEPQVFLADFSRDVWKSRHEVSSWPCSAGCERPDPGAQEIASEEIGAAPRAARRPVRRGPRAAPGLLFDLMTGAVYVRVGRGSADLKVVSPRRARARPRPARPLAARSRRRRAEALDFLELSTESVIVLVAIVAEAQEGIALLADQSQPMALMSAALVRAAHDYASRLPGARPHGVPVTPLRRSGSGVHHRAAVHAQDLAVEVAREVRGQEGHGSRDLFGTRRAAQGDGLQGAPCPPGPAGCLSTCR